MDLAQKETTFIKLGYVTKRTGLSRATIFRDIEKGMFPKPVKLGKRNYAWVAHELEEWIERRIKERDQEQGESRSQSVEDRASGLSEKRGGENA